MKFVLVLLIVAGIQLSQASWDSYIDNLLGHAKGMADLAAIIGLDGAKWTTDSHPNSLKISAVEAQNIARAFKSKDFSPFMAHGIRIAGIKYTFLREMDNKIVYAKKKDNGAIAMEASKTAIVIGHTKEGASAGDTNTAVGLIAGYLESLGM